MNKMYKAALLAAIGIGAISSAQASTDLILGFNDAAGPAAAQNDYVIDLGLNGATLISDAKAAGGTFTFADGTINASTFSTAFGQDANALNNLGGGVVGGFTGSNPKLLYQTVGLGLTPTALSAGGLVNTAANAAQGTQVGEYSSANTAGWSALVNVSPAIFGNTASGGSVPGATGTSAEGQVTGGLLSMELWGNQRNTATGPAIGWVDLGTFNINLNTDAVSFSVSAVPEPTTCVLMGVAGVLLVALRRQFKNA
jgi:hypothetical protein